MTKNYIVNASFHHRSQKQPWVTNLQAESETEAIIKAYQEAILQEFGLLANHDDLVAVAEKPGEITIQCREEGFEEEVSPVVVWYESPDNRGCGAGNTIRETSKEDNVWIKVRVQKNTKQDLIDTIRGNMYRLEDLKISALKEIRDILEG